MGENNIATDPDCKLVESEDSNGKEIETKICSPQVQDIKVIDSYLHPHYSLDPGAPNDIALLRLKKPAILGPSVNIVCLPSNNKLAIIDFVAIGFGITNYTLDKGSDVLMFAKLSYAECNMENYHWYDEEKQFCGGGPSKLKIF